MARDKQHDLWRKLGCLVLALTIPFVCAAGEAAGFQVVDSPYGKLLVTDSPEPDSSAGDLEQLEIIRDPFNWSPALVAQQQIFEPPRDNPVISGLSLSGIVWDEQAPVAVIDDTLLAIGDQISGAVVRAITVDEVVLELEDEYYTLQFSALYELDQLHRFDGRKIRK